MSKEPKVPLRARISPVGAAWLDELATKTGTTRTEALRAALYVAARHSTAVEQRLLEVAAS